MWVRLSNKNGDLEEKVGWAKIHPTFSFEKRVSGKNPRRKDEMAYL